jgi:hypothetical protein
LNGSQLALGVRQSGRPVNDVELPPWASSPEDALAKHRCGVLVGRVPGPCVWGAACVGLTGVCHKP